MSERIKIGKADPAAYKAMLAFENYLPSTRISALHHELIRIRASQINGCTYCIDKHAKSARDHGETEQRLYALAHWRDTPFFTEEEQVILAITEEVTLITKGLSDETYAKAAALFDEEYLAQVIMAAIVINAWNRIGVATHMQPVKG